MRIDVTKMGTKKTTDLIVFLRKRYKNVHFKTSAGRNYIIFY
jgi:hypothetical protein